ncbi:MAG: glycosyltransferase [Lachnospiraceae bacterium]|nr:glycosyltransferase [Lachnospiraceae bacterium]
MSIFDFKKLHTLYEDEYLKQTSPYEYYVKYCEDVDMDNRGMLSESSPLFFNEAKTEEERKAARFLKEVFPRHNILLFKTERGSFLLFAYSKGELEEGYVKEALDSLREGFRGLLYFDHDYIREGRRLAPCLKPDFSYDTFMNINYLEEIFAVDMETALDLSGSLMREEPKEVYTGLLFIYECLKVNEVIHISKTALHIASDLSKEEEIWESYYRDHSREPVRRAYEKLWKEKDYGIALDKYSLSIVIPSKDNSSMLKQCLESIENNRAAGKMDLQVIVVDNGSHSKEKERIEELLGKLSLKAKEEKREHSFDYIYEPMDFNFSRMCNLGARAARKALIMFMNDDIELGSENCLESMCLFAKDPDIGIVGIKLLYPNSLLIQHDGVDQLECGPSHKLMLHGDDKVYYFGINRFNRNLLAITAAAFLMSKEKYFNLGGFNDKMEVGYNDVDLCLSFYESGYRNMIVNSDYMYHHESVSRGRDMGDNKKLQRLMKERELLYEEHSWYRPGADPFYNKRLIRDTLDYSIDLMPGYEKRDEVSLVRSVTPSEIKWLKMKRRGKNSKNIHFNIEKDMVEPAIFRDRKDLILLEGWLLKNKADNSLFKRELYLIPEDMMVSESEKADERSAILVSLFPKRREDVQDAFKEAKRGSLSGFVAKIPLELIDVGKGYVPIFLLTSLVSGFKYMAAGDVYEWSGK